MRRRRPTHNSHGLQVPRQGPLLTDACHTDQCGASRSRRRGDCRRPSTRHGCTSLHSPLLELMCAVPPGCQRPELQAQHDANCFCHVIDSFACCCFAMTCSNLNFGCVFLADHIAVAPGTGRCQVGREAASGRAPQTRRERESDARDSAAPGCAEGRARNADAVHVAPQARPQLAFKRTRPRSLQLDMSLKASQ